MSRERIVELQLENDHLRVALEKEQRRPVSCVYCGQAFLGDDAGRMQLARHIARCEKHPLGRLVRVTEYLLQHASQHALCDGIDLGELRAAVEAAKEPSATHARSPS